MSDRPTLVLIDGHSLAFRAFHALPLTLTAPTGELTNAVFGFVSMLLNVLRDHEPVYVAVAFDVGKTFRHAMYAEYKGHRERMPDELRTQIERIKEVVEALNIPIFTKEGFEADDVLAALARQAEAQGVDSLIVTGDRDILQVVDDHISVLTSGRKFSDTIVYTPESVQEKYGLRPDQLVDLKALIGDKSDNIPGVRGVGEKGATNLLQAYGTLDAVYAHVDDISPERTRKALQEGAESAELSRKLGRIITDVPIRLDLAACHTRDYDRARVIDLFQDLAFRSLVDRLPAPEKRQRIEADKRIHESGGAEEQMALFPTETTPQSTNEPASQSTNLPIYQPTNLPIYQSTNALVTDAATLADVAARLAAAPMIAFDTETTSTDPQIAELVGVALAWQEQKPGFSEKPGFSAAHNAAYIPVRHGDVTPLPWEVVRQALGPAFADARITKVAHNASYDLTMLARNGLPVAGDLVDTMIAAWLIDPGSRGLGLKDQAWTRLKVEMTHISELIGTGKHQITMDQVPAAQAAAYASADAAMTLGLVDVLLPELEERGLTSLFRDVEMPLVPVLVAMETAGIKLDVGYLAQMSAELTARLRQIELEIQQIAGYAFNINSTQQLSDVLFGKLGLPAEGLKKTKAGAYSTAADVLEGLRGKHEIIDLILEQRQLSKLLSTYVDALPTMVNPRTGRLHTSFNQTGAETGRLSSSAPNLQNIPVRSEIGREIRRAFVAEPGWQLLSADYSQVELRILAHISGDEYLLAAFARGEDIHASAAAKVYGVPLSQVTKEQRSVAKMMNFATSYGVSAYGLAQRTGLSRADAEQFMARYFATYPGVKRYLEEAKAFAYEHGYVETLLGRRRYFPVLKTTATDNRAFNTRQAAERAAINHPIQGSAADIIKIAMIRLHRALQQGGYRTRITLQVHDELVLEAPDAELAAVGRLVKETMEGAYKLKAALVVDLEAGPNWYEMAGVSL
ncbi:MAG: DNA polymerase I [Chloroflexi bacterium HGW-Chloroflexi-1]|nr:MAG: DNA polymerase I [Chloroflexi bacterium HGW-Chloroflexi-1]